MIRWILIGTVSQVAMVLVGHWVTSVQALFGPLGVLISLLVGFFWARSEARNGRHGALGGAVVGGACALLGIIVSFSLGDAPAVILAFGTLSSALAGALAGAVGGILRGRALGASQTLGILVFLAIPLAGLIVASPVDAQTQRRGASAPSSGAGDVDLATLSDFSWLEGTWRGTGPKNATAEIHYMAPTANVLPSLFRLWKGDELLVLETITLVEADAGLMLYVRHFTPQMDPLEADRPLTLKLVSRQGQRFLFENLYAENPRSVVLERTGSDTFRSWSELLRNDGSRAEIEVDYRRMSETGER